MATLTDVNDQLQVANKEQGKQADEQKKTNNLLNLIGKDFKTFFKEQRNSRLDELEKEREKKRTVGRVDERGRFIAQKDKKDSEVGLFDIGIIGAAIATTLGATAGLIGGIFKTYLAFWTRQKVTLDKTIKTAQKANPLSWIRATTSSLANTIRSATFARLGLGVDGKILTQFNPQTRRFERVDSIGARLVDIGRKVTEFRKSLFGGFEVDGKKLTLPKFPSFSFEGIQNAVTNVLNRLGVFGQIVRGVFNGVATIVKRLITPFIALKGLFDGFVETEGNIFQKGTNAVINAVQDLFRFLVSDFIGLIINGIAGIVRFLGAEGLANFLNKVSATFKEGFDSIFEGLKFAVENPGEAFNFVGEGISKIFGGIGNWWDSVVQYFIDTFDKLKSNPLKFFFPSLGETTAGEVRAQREIDNLDDDQQSLVRSQKAQLVRLEVARDQGRISEDELKQMTMQIKELVESQGVSMSTVVNAPVTTNTSSNTTLIDTPSPATDSLDRTR